MYKRSIGKYRLGCTYTIIGITLRYEGFTDESLIFTRINNQGVECETIRLARTVLGI